MQGIGDTMVGTTDLPRTLARHDPLFAPMGLDQWRRDAHSAFWGKPEDARFAGCPPDIRPTAAWPASGTGP